jgi:TolB-like protein/tetratricopeptide (TPR) repeat protein
MTGTIDRHTVETELARVIASPAFARAARGRELLAYLIDNQLSVEPKRLKEATIALEVFGRDAAVFDGERDGIVRVAVNRLRDLLDRHYAEHGRDAPIRFEIPRGGYVPIIRRATPVGLPERARVAVLPLANLTGAIAQDALCDGLTEDVIDALAQIPALRVTARTSSFRYKGVASDIRHIARELDVDALLEGSVQSIEGRLRVTAQLILASDGTHQWSHAFEEDADDRHLLQQSLRELVVRSIARDAQPLEISSPINVDPQARYLVDQARMLNMTQLPDNVARAEKLADEAVAIAPNFVDAWFVQAMVRYSRYSLWMSSASHSLASIDETLQRALTLDANYPQALSLSAYVAILAKWDWTGALDLALRAAMLAPSHAGILGRLGAVRLALGNHNGAIAAYRDCVACDPYAPPAYTGLANAHSFAGNTAEALKTIDLVDAKCGQSAYTLESRIVVHLHARQFEKAEALAEQALCDSPNAWPFRFRRAQAANGLGKSETVLDDFGAIASSAPSSNLSYLRTMIAAFDRDSTTFFETAKNTIADRTPHCMLLFTDPATRDHRSDPRWQDLVALAQYPGARTNASTQ